MKKIFYIFITMCLMLTSCGVNRIQSQSETVSVDSDTIDVCGITEEEAEAASDLGDSIPDSLVCPD